MLPARPVRGYRSGWPEQLRPGFGREALEVFLNAWDKKHGTLTAADLGQAERELGIGAPKKSGR